jgi:SAM-dependent methyltransferase
MSGASELYDALAPHYREYADRKAPYLASVDRFIRDNFPPDARTLLDVGAGDGVRGMAIARAQGVEDVVLCDPSPEMAARCRSLSPADVWTVGAEMLPATERRFDVILCLWNVLGHLPGRAARVRALSNMRALLSERGVIFFDVNNRHNASAYGWRTVLGRVVLDRLLFDERRGDASFDWNVAGRVFPAMGHLFTPAEIREIVRVSGLDEQRLIAIDYATGARSASLLRGQLVFMVKRGAGGSP